MSKMQSRRRQQGQAQTVSDGEEESRTEKSAETTSRSRNSQADRPSPKDSDASGNHSDPASTEGARTPTKSKSTPTRRSKSLTNHSAKTDQDASPKPTSRKQNVTSKARSTATKTSSENDQKSSPKPVINAYDVSESPPFRKYMTNSRGRGNFRESPQFSTGHGRGRGSTRGGRQARRQFHDPTSSQTSNVQESVSVDKEDADSVKVTSTESVEGQAVGTADPQDARPNHPQDKPSFHRGAPRGRYRGDPSFRRGRGSWRGFHRGGNHPRAPNYPSSPQPSGWSSASAVDTPVSDGPSHVDEKDGKVDADVEQLADSVSQTSLAAGEQVAAGDQPTGDTKDAADQARREAKRDKARKKRQAKRLSMKMANSDSKESLPNQSPIPESSATKTQLPSDRPKKSHKTRPFSKSNPMSRDEALKNESNSATLEVSPDVVSDAAAHETVSQPAESSSPAKVEGNDDKPKRQRKQHNHRSPAQNVDMKDKVAVQTPADDSHQEPSATTTEYTHHKYKKNFARQEDNIRPAHPRNDVPVPMAHQMQPAVSTPSFVSQPVAFAITSPNGGPIPVYTMPFPPMNPAMGDGQGGRQGMFYAPMMGSPGATASTPTSATPTMMDPNNMMYMPYDSQQMMMYNPYWYQPVGMTQQGMPPPNPGWNAAGGGDYSNNWKHPSQHDATYHPSTSVAYTNEHMSYPNDNNGPQAVYYYPVSY
ncbi:hypothetical protein K450DRAFT_218420 [Umbelopsis ramanniana AG]|uniref:Btz domain-containing protein n=1 Tax=Umbelopsis ramanniana AG TaxID=1314678 RepID=A0AAD5EIQ6_UMBRA|nr:uncharacterized protein K450DRAFT_218420 [Umbelopsis ramanniana AG]KAI8584152.1 hypothetical protein K450DRAFT_218420 [Umbelopsis ramanniana AG]